MIPERLEKLRIPDRERPSRSRFPFLVAGAIAILAVVAAAVAWPRKEDSRRIVGKAPEATSPTPSPEKSGGALLTTSGYIINRERIELSPRFSGVVKWVGARKGDRVQRNQVVVLLEDSEQRARLAEAESRLARAESVHEIAATRMERFQRLREQRVESQQQLDDAAAELRAAEAGVREASALVDLARTQLDWTVIRSPLDGVVLEKLADENELVSPQSFGGDSGPSTALLAIADPADLQVELDINEADLSKIRPGQPCRVSPEAFPERSYEGYVVEIAPEANRQKGTLQVKVQIKKPDKWLVPELSARVDFLPPVGP